MWSCKNNHILRLCITDVNIIPVYQLLTFETGMESQAVEVYIWSKFLDL